ncbi:MAG: hypothetical protein LPL13_13895, partial [Alphaproteobacteria bacterium]|nr:hypothetical protein [Alphaproteobacteria bacterium]
MAKTYGEGYLAIATGGLYLLAKGLWDRTQANSDVCAEILAKRKEVKQRPVQAGTSPDQAVTPGDGVQVTAPAPGAGAKPVKKPEPQKDPFKALEIAD